MSQSRVTRQAKPPQPIVRWLIALGVATVLIVAAVYLAANWIHSLSSTYETTAGTILEIRKVVDHTRDTLYGGKIIYRAEAHVRYLADVRYETVGFAPRTICHKKACCSAGCSSNRVRRLLAAESPRKCKISLK